MEGRVEDMEEDREDNLVVVPVELVRKKKKKKKVRQAIVAWS